MGLGHPGSKRLHMVAAMYILRQQTIIRRQMETIRRASESLHDRVVPEVLTRDWEGGA